MLEPCPTPLHTAFNTQVDAPNDTLSMHVPCWPATCCHPAVSHFWAAYAAHLATSTSPAAPFLPEHLTSAAASTAAAACALAVLGLPFTPSSATAAAAGRSKAPVSAVQCSYQGASMMLTANSPCLVYLKCIEQVLSTSSAPGAAASSTSSGAGPAALSSAVNSSVLVVQQLFDPLQPDALDPETGEKVLQQVDPATQQLLVGRVYGLRCVVTSMSASEQQLELLLQVGQGLRVSTQCTMCGAACVWLPAQMQLPPLYVLYASIVCVCIITVQCVPSYPAQSPSGLPAL
jgi:hypothetical protein